MLSGREAPARFRASAEEALLPAPVGADRFVIRATQPRTASQARIRGARSGRPADPRDMPDQRAVRTPEDGF